jgi:hypothetical protein
MESFKEHRFNDNPKEKELFDKFVKQYGEKHHYLSAIIFGWGNDSQTEPKQYLTEQEVNVCANLIQWLGSHVGQGFLAQCGFTVTKNTETNYRPQGKPKFQTPMDIALGRHNGYED